MSARLPARSSTCLPPKTVLPLQCKQVALSHFLFSGGEQLDFGSLPASQCHFQQALTDLCVKLIKIQRRPTNYLRSQRSPLSFTHIDQRLNLQVVANQLDPLDFSKASLWGWGSLVAERQGTSDGDTSLSAYSGRTRQSRERETMERSKGRERMTSAETERRSVLTQREAARARERLT